MTRHASFPATSAGPRPAWGATERARASLVGRRDLAVDVAAPGVARRRERDREARAAALLALHCDVAVVTRHDAMDDAEAESRPAHEGPRREERIEDPIEVSRVDAGAVV